MTPGEKKRRIGVRKTEVKTLLTSIEEFEEMAEKFLVSVEKGKSLEQIGSSDSTAARLREKALSKALTVKEKFLPECKKIKANLTE